VHTSRAGVTRRGRVYGASRGTTRQEASSPRASAAPTRTRSLLRTTTAARRPAPAGTTAARRPDRRSARSTWSRRSSSSWAWSYSVTRAGPRSPAVASDSRAAVSAAVVGAGRRPSRWERVTAWARACPSGRGRLENAWLLSVESQSRSRSARGTVSRESNSSLPTLSTVYLVSWTCALPSSSTTNVGSSPASARRCIYQPPFYLRHHRGAAARGGALEPWRGGPVRPRTRAALMTGRLAQRAAQDSAGARGGAASIRHFRHLPVAPRLPAVHRRPAPAPPPPRPALVAE